MEVIILHPQYDTSSMEFNNAPVLLNETTKEDVAFVKLNENASHLVVAGPMRLGWDDRNVILEVTYPSYQTVTVHVMK